MAMASSAVKVRERSYLWSSVDPTLPYPLPCYDPLTMASSAVKVSRKRTSAASGASCCRYEHDICIEEVNCHVSLPQYSCCCSD